MSDDFPRTQASLDSDRSLASRLGAAAATLVLAGWGYVLFSERPVLEVAAETRLEVEASGVRIVARFEEEARARIHPGQRARVTLADGSVRGATVVDVPADGAPRAELALDDGDGARALASLESSPPHRVEVEVERISTALRLLRAAGAR